MSLLTSLSACLLVLLPVCLACWPLESAATGGAAPDSSSPPDADADVLGPRQLALVINDADPDSVAIGEYYRERRAIPATNIVHVRLPTTPALDPARFHQLRREIDSRLGPDIQAVLMVWSAPYKVGCNAITAAYTLGYDGALCPDTCRASAPSRVFNAPGRRPYSRYGLRLSMLLPIASRPAARALIDRGVLSGFQTRPASAWYLSTSEPARNSRVPFFPRAGYLAAHKLHVHRLQADAIEQVDDILVYQLGKASVDKLDSLRFVPGALADHLTSHGGELSGSGQMSSLRWLEAGATASYGTVSEPCNHWQKFPNPLVLLRHYLDGETAIEAYWKSVAWPAQGLFIGEPLASPYASLPRDASRQAISN